MVPAGTVVALDPPVPHVAAHWFVLMWRWVFHIVHQQVFEHCHYLWTTNTTPRPGNMMEKVGIKSKLMQIVNSVAFKSAAIMLQFLHVTDLFHVSQNGSCLLFSWLMHDQWGMMLRFKKSQRHKTSRPNEHRSHLLFNTGRTIEDKILIHSSGGTRRLLDVPNNLRLNVYIRTASTLRIAM